MNTNVPGNIVYVLSREWEGAARIEKNLRRVR